MKGLAALKAANFDWVMRLDDVWRDLPHDVPVINAHLRQTILDRCGGLGPKSPLGWVILGPAGSGKTHLLASLRRDSEALGAFFILVDMTDVKDFWETLLLGYLSSLREPENRPQYRRLLVDLLTLVGQDAEKAVRSVVSLSKVSKDSLVENSSRVIQVLGQKHRQKVIEHQDVLRALLLLNSDDFHLGNLGYNYLLGVDLEGSQAQALGFRQSRQEAIKILRGLSWIMSLRGPTLLALDQLDAIVSEHHIAAGLREDGDRSEERRVAHLIIENMGRGLSALADHTNRTLCLVSCLESTWDILRRTALKSSTDRYEAPRKLLPLAGPEAVTGLVAKRVAPAFRSVGLRPPYPTWPFKPEALAQVAGWTPREVLKRCEAHRQKCLETGLARELEVFAAAEIAVQTWTEREEFSRIDAVFEERRRQADLSDLTAEDKEEELGGLIQSACRCLIREAPLREDVDVLLETQFGGGRSYAPLHVRVSLVQVSKGAQETHICFRALQKTNPTAFLARITAAMTAAGIDRRLSFRRLFLVRTTALPETPKCKEAVANYLKAGGRFIETSDDELRVLYALASLERTPPSSYDEWLQVRRPISGLRFIQEALPEFRLWRAGAAAAPAPRAAVTETSFEVLPVEVKPAVTAERREARPPAKEIYLGRRLKGPETFRKLTLPLSLLSRHAVILGADTAGRAHLIRRLIEGAALAGVPSLVLDSGGDLALLGEPWPEPPRSWPGGEAELARRYHERTEVVVYTPGVTAGRPLGLPILPDFREMGRGQPVAGWSETLADLARLGASGLAELTVGGWLGRSKKRSSVLVSALRYFGQTGGGGLQDFIALLDKLPPEAGSRLRSAPKMAREMAERLRVKIDSDPFYRQDGVPLGADDLLKGRSGRIRVSVISLMGLDTAERRRLFLARLAAALYVWLLRRTKGGEPSLKGLLVVGEARDYLPPAGESALKEGLLRLAALGRSAGLGLILSSEHPKEFDLEAVRSAATWIVGLAGSSGSQRLMKKVLEEHGGAGEDPGKLEPGQFYVTSVGHLSGSERIAVAPGLSHHPDRPLTIEDLLRKAHPAADPGLDAGDFLPAADKTEGEAERDIVL
ncbi:MAG: hypothetical protein AB1641_21870 [Thermodesulfobacteriota bacterium]